MREHFHQKEEPPRAKVSDGEEKEGAVFDREQVSGGRKELLAKLEYFVSQFIPLLSSY